VKSVWVVPYSVLVGLLAGGILFLVSKPVQGEPIELKPPPTQAPILVHISGQVIQPGIYSLPSGSRVADAVEAAGGMTDQADESKINLASLLDDGQKIQVPAIQNILAGQSETHSGASPSIEDPLDLNTASQVELESLPEIGPKTALAILTYRDEHGPFKTVEELLDVPGIGPATLAKIRDLVAVNP
jgi:competence protein ComEA